MASAAAAQIGAAGAARARGLAHCRRGRPARFSSQDAAAGRCSRFVRASSP
ncbi:hypothetical protein LC55x_1665 [Lysobacter capsici]|nr:hypothetical protein LC55x_1665 [Lysobacter capsici]